MSLLAIENLSVGYATSRGLVRALDGVDLAVEPGEVHALVGESGSGKSTLAYAALRYLAPNARVTGGRVAFAGTDMLALDDEALRRLRGGRVGVVYQDPASALNPAMRLGEQVAEVLRWHRGLDAAAARQAVRDLFARVRLPDPALIADKFPHEVSGGEKQRVVIAMAIACAPELLILDEPTTALDATTAVAVLDLLKGLQRETGVAALAITHDLGIAREIATRVSVIYAGRIVETGSVEAVLGAPAHPYTRALASAVPNPHRLMRRQRLSALGGPSPDLIAPPPGCNFQQRCPFAAEICKTGPIALAGDDHRVACVRRGAITAATATASAPARAAATQAPILTAQGLSVVYTRRRLLDRLRGRPPRVARALNQVDLSLAAGETLGIVGESGSGKSTLARALVGLNQAGGAVALDGAAIDWRAAGGFRRAVQIIFQHPDLALNPRMTVGAALGRPLKLAGFGDALSHRVERLLDLVRLGPETARRYPHELSGGQKQRVCIARAFAAEPRVVICDEITSGLDVSVQAAIMNLLLDLQDKTGVAYIFISHDLNLVQHIADRVAVMYFGRVVELRAGALMAPPYHPYTEALLSAAPVPDPRLAARRIRLTGTPPSPLDPPAGCAFHARCPDAIAGLCASHTPPLRRFGEDRWALCHLTAAQLTAKPPVWQDRAS